MSACNVHMRLYPLPCIGAGNAEKGCRGTRAHGRFVNRRDRRTEDKDIKT